MSMSDSLAPGAPRRPRRRDRSAGSAPGRWCASASAASSSASARWSIKPSSRLLAGGHALLIGVPGLAKTRLVETLGTVLGLEDKRIQCTPDLMPADIIGSEVLEESETRPALVPLHSRAGVLPAADGGRDQPRQPAHPIGAAAGDAGGPRLGRRPISSAAASRSTCWRRRTRSSRKAPIRCPRRSSTASCCRSTSAIPISRPSGRCCSPPPASSRSTVTPVLSAAELAQAQRLVRRIPVGESVVEAILSLVRSGRPERVRPGPRPSTSPGARARARARR